MDIITKKTLTDLNQDSVSVLTQKYVTVDGQELQVGENHRCAYANSKSGRIELENEPKNVVDSILAIWGDTPTIIESKE